MRTSNNILRCFFLILISAVFCRSVTAAGYPVAPFAFSGNRFILSYGNNRNTLIKAYYCGRELVRSDINGKIAYLLPDILFIDSGYCLNIEFKEAGVSYQARVPFWGKVPVLLSVPHGDVAKGTVIPIIIEILPGLSAPEVTVNGEMKPIHESPDGLMFFYIVHSVSESNGARKLTIKLQNKPAADVSFGYNLTGTYPRERIGLLKKGKEDAETAALKALLLRCENSKVKRLIDDELCDASGWDGSFFMPLEGRITSGFGITRSYNGRGYREYHKGVDIGGNPVGTEVRASAPGIVICAEEMYVRGGTVIIDHGLGIKTLYYHLESQNVNVGDRVCAGDLIATVGTTGFSTGPHLHWELRVDGTPVSPEEALDGVFKILFKI